VQEEHAQHAREKGDEATALRAAERAERARERAKHTPPGRPVIPWMRCEGGDFPASGRS
jgi:hypothetical protein